MIVFGTSESDWFYEITFVRMYVRIFLKLAMKLGDF